MIELTKDWKYIEKMLIYFKTIDNGFSFGGVQTVE